LCPFGDDGEEPLEVADVPSVGIRYNGEGEVVRVRKHESPWESHVQWGDIDEKEEEVDH